MKAWNSGKSLLIEGLKDVGQIRKKSKKSIINGMLNDGENCVA